MRAKGRQEMSKRLVLVSGGVAVVCLVLLLVWLSLPYSAGSLVGMSLSEVKSRLGPPDSVSSRTVPASWAGCYGPHPMSLREGQEYVAVWYRSHRGRIFSVFCVAPDVYRQVTGTNPGQDKLYVIEAYDFPDGVVI